jgi:signal transduction histidine kinase
LDATEPKFRANLAELIDVESFDQVLHAFYKLFEIPCRVFDEHGVLLVGTKETNPICAHLNGFTEGRDRCTAVRTRIKRALPETTEIGYVECFCGLKYAIVPLVFQTEVAGKLAFGPYLPRELEQIPESLQQLDDGFDPAKYSEIVNKTRRLGRKTLRRIIDTIAAVIDVILFSAHKAHLTGELHVAAMRESYHELTAKNRRLEEMNEEMKEFERQKSNFLAMVSHELRTPLTSIIGYSDMLSEGIAGKLAAEQKQFVETIKTKGDELLRLISSILDFSQIDTGHLTLQPVETSVKELVKASLRNNRELAERRGVKLSYEIPAGLPSITLDPEKIRTSIGHLIDNAVKFSPPGALVKVSARVVPSSEEDGAEDGFGFVLMAAPDMLEISIEDFGAGIEDADQARIFSPFTQLDASSTREHGGAGLGLAIVKHYVEAHGGRVRLTSSVGEGSRFAIRLPLIDNGQIEG